MLVGKYVLKPATVGPVGPVGGLLQSRIRPPWTLAQRSDDGTKSIQHHEGNYKIVYMHMKRLPNVPNDFSILNPF